MGPCLTWRMASFYDVLAVLQPPYGEHGVGKGIFGFLSTREALPLRLVSSVLCADVRNARWCDRDTVIGDLRAWRACFSDARCANVSGRRDLVDADMVHLSGVEEMDLSGCTQITDAGLAHLTGIHTLNMSWCPRITDAGLVHLTGIHRLVMRGCEQITDAGLAHFIHTLDMNGCFPAVVVGRNARVARAEPPPQPPPPSAALAAKSRCVCV